jgi:2-hydroxyglutarate dehydrogenase
MQTDAKDLGASISYNTTVISACVVSKGLELHVGRTKELQNYHVGCHVNAQLALLPTPVKKTQHV